MINQIELFRRLYYIRKFFPGGKNFWGPPFPPKKGGKTRGFKNPGGFKKGGPFWGFKKPQKFFPGGKIFPRGKKLVFGLFFSHQSR